MGLTRLMFAASAAALISACANEAEEAAPEAAAVEPMTDAVEPMTEAEPMAAAGDDEDPIGTANVSIDLNNGVPYFASSGESFCTNGGCQGGVGLDTGNIDLSSFPPGDVLVTVTLGADASGAGYLFPADPYQAVAIAVIPPGAPPPTPVFGQTDWPSDFDPPTVSSDQLTLTFVDEEEDSDLYEYSIGLNGPNGRVIMDPTIQNTGKPPAPEPEPIPQE